MAKNEISISGMQLLPNGEQRVMFRFQTESGPKDGYLQLTVLEGHLYIAGCSDGVQSNLKQID